MNSKIVSEKIINSALWSLFYYLFIIFSMQF